MITAKAIPAAPAVPHPPAELERIPLVANNRSFGWISNQIAGLCEGKAPVWWWVLFIPSFLALFQHSGIRSLEFT